MRRNLETIFALSFILLTYGCAQVDELPGNDLAGYSPITLATDSAGTGTRAGIPEGMFEKFEVFALFRKSGVSTVVMDKYVVTYVAPTWTYESPSQPLQYWMRDADEYRFTAGSCRDMADVLSLDADQLKLHMLNNRQGSSLYCHPLRIGAADPEFGKVVNLRFGYAHCRVMVAFVKESDADALITDITLTPSDPITSEAEMTFSFDWNATPAATTAQVTQKTATSAASLDFEDVTIPANTADAVKSASMYYCIPDASNPTGWNISLKCDGEPKAASFENTHTWECGKNYIYVFSLTAKAVKLVHVVSQELEDSYFDCNPVLPGGSFSEGDMTENP